MGNRALATVTAFLLLVATQFVLATSALASGTVTRSRWPPTRTCT